MQLQLLAVECDRAAPANFRVWQADADCGEFGLLRRHAPGKREVCTGVIECLYLQTQCMERCLETLRAPTAICLQQQVLDLYDVWWRVLSRQLPP